MNINQLKAFLSDKPQHLGNENSLKNQLRDAGLSQALQNQAARSTVGEDKFSSSTTLGLRIYATSFNQTLEVGRNKPDFSVPEKKDQQDSLFDFKEVAKNVLNFVGGAIKNAKTKGADDAQLNALFEQASSGVLKGIKMAERDLAGFMNDEIAQGIEQSKNLIENGIDRLKNQIFSTDEPDKDVVSTEQVKVEYLKQQQGELNIRTRDGDTVTLSFSDLQQFEFSQKQFELQQQERQTPANQSKDNQAVQPTEQNAEQTGTEDTNNATVETEQQNLNQQPVANQSGDNQTITEQNVVYMQQNALSFSVKGELDEDELKAIGQLVADTNDLAEEFFNGDIETAFNQALELGFDQQELASFALQLTKVENTRVIKTYETVSHLDEDNTESDPAKAVKPVAEYLDKLLNVLDGARLKLENQQSYENVVNELINRLGEEVATPDLISAINRFNEFNQRLVNNLPIGYQPEATN